jgi:SAM-dependent methyltransferase
MNKDLGCESEAVTCRLCDSGRTTCLGTIPDSDYFAGRVLEHPIQGGRLWRCNHCQSMFRHPVLENCRLLELYGEGAADSWNAGGRRQDLEIVRGIITQRLARGSVLDVGCGSGEFLLTLPAQLNRCGVEPSVAAAAAASSQGLTILAPTLALLSPQITFDVITMIDVVEHVSYPGHLLQQALSHLVPGGILVVATGDPSNFFWRRVFRARYWYSSFPEHVTFPSSRYFHEWHEGKGLQPPQVLRLRYRHITALRTAAYLLTQVLYFASPRLLNWLAGSADRLLRSPSSERRSYSPGGPGVFTDHQIVTIQRLP